jgi:hypothetical protein
MISVLHEHGHCVGFLRSAGPRGFTAYNADGQLLGLFQDKQAAVEAITAASSMAETEFGTFNGDLIESRQTGPG